MKVPGEMRSYCPSCRKHANHIVSKVIYRRSPPPARKTAKGQLRHTRKTKGYTSKIAGRRQLDKKSSKNVILLECLVCHKKHQKRMGMRTRKKAEIKK